MSIAMDRDKQHALVREQLKITEGSDQDVALRMIIDKEAHGLLTWPEAIELIVQGINAGREQ